MAFFERTGTKSFDPPTPMRGYLSQLNEWSLGTITWDVLRIGGADHMPTFEAVPILNGERLETFASIGPSKKTAMEEAAARMALSGHC
ncbi:hypothetical protein OBBRIDRAFT_744750 [Obba rivulosa]|uniref:DRBM domain-containing protein n=1 Tax=Obba rivulosa TaxID=1052685 RepID=A0A8E2DU16_9APHY|nr:hypothetical protein OBBRIDRAFT_744750 [Obba rivulosa]